MFIQFNHVLAKKLIKNHKAIARKSVGVNGTDSEKRFTIPVKVPTAGVGNTSRVLTFDVLSKLIIDNPVLQLAPFILKENVAATSSLL